MALRGRKIGWLAVLVIAVFVVAIFAIRGGQEQPAHPEVLRVVLIPADGGTADGTLADYRPLFSELSRATGLRFDLSTTQSYSAAVQALCSGTADIAFLGPSSFLRARQGGCAELLAVGMRRGQTSYYSVILVRGNSAIRDAQGLRGARLALGDVNSTSSFQMPLLMLMGAGLDPVRDLAAIRLTGSHPESLNALLRGHVDAAGLSLDSYERALRKGMPGAAGLRILLRSDPLPYPPFAVSTRLSPALREQLSRGFASLATRNSKGVAGYAGGRLDGYLASASSEPYDRLAAQLARLTPEIRAGVLARAAERSDRHAR